MQLQEYETMPLNTEERDPMYLLGRAWAVCEAAITEAGMARPTTGIMLAGSDPQHGFAPLHARFISALAKMRSERNTESVQYYEELMSSIMEHMPSRGMPSQGLIEREGPLHIGYWHQRAALKADAT
jgi:CRISPR-associated protein (Cas_Csd1)